MANLVLHLYSIHTYIAVLHNMRNTDDLQVYYMYMSYMCNNLYHHIYMKYTHVDHTCNTHMAQFLMSNGKDCVPFNMTVISSHLTRHS